MAIKEKQNTKNTTKEKSVLAEAKEEISESEKIENEQVEEIPQTEIETEAMKSAESVGQEQNQKVEEIPQAENLSPVEIQEVESASAEISKIEPSFVKTMEDEQIKTVEKIIYKTDPNFVQKLLIKARAKIQERKRKKLDKIMTLFETKTQIRNKDVRKSLFVKKRTATNYLNQLEKEQRIIQMGKKGNEVFYVKKP
ncbi:MAG: hypothetical protein KAV41_02265 [Candidatus Pacebacteria bacterium]|nr:hypothetical protein [Candidatus Paceibacterota bacterium]